jgi:predicted HTH domain antitoxin
MKTIFLEEVSIKNAVRLMMEESELDTFKKVAEASEMSTTTFQSALDRNAIKLRDFQRIVEVLGYSIRLEKK